MQKLQSRVRSKLLNQLYFLDHSDPRHLVSRRYEMECLDLLHKVSILYAEREYKLTERLLQRCLRLAEMGEFTHYLVQSARMLRNLHAEQRQVIPYKKVAKALLRAQQVLAWEDEAEQIYRDTQAALGSTVAARRKVLAIMPERIEHLETLHRRARSFTTYNAVYRARLAYEELQGNFTEMIRVTAAAARRLRDGKLNARRFDLRFNHFVCIYAYLRSRQPVQGLRLAEEYSRDFHPSSSNWFYFQEHHVLLALHAEQYERAQQLLGIITKNPAYPIQREAALQRWDLYKGYIDFVLPPQRATTARQRQLAQWVLQLPEYSRDKRGHNVAILVLQAAAFPARAQPGGSAPAPGAPPQVPATALVRTHHGAQPVVPALAAADCRKELRRASGSGTREIAAAAASGNASARRGLCRGRNHSLRTLVGAGIGPAARRAAGAKRAARPLACRRLKVRVRIY
ncbi:hypothetical protein ACFQT0_06790 [Hymenobacter humi]|uniref:Tetratricopeptide repeat protein n=1 Tax=Hymenobacter humi TaxID=1411620 RepID=A0ABW2U1E3_9BACT